MRPMSARLTLLLVLLCGARAASAQTVDEVIEKSIGAAGGRAALGKIQSRVMTGTITLQTPAGDLQGTVEVQNALPNKSRSLVKADLTALGAGMITVDERFDGNVGYALDTLRGNHDITGNQLDNLRNNTFPHPYLKYKENGTAARLIGREKIDGRDVFVLEFEPTAGSAIRQYLDAETYLVTRTVVSVDVPELGQKLDLTTDLLDYREVDGVKLPFKLSTSSAVQNYTIAFEKIEHNVPIDAAVFTKPAPQ